MSYQLHYGSIMQAKTSQDIEGKKFRTIDELIIYASSRIETSFDGIYTASFELPINELNRDEFPSALVTRNWKELVLYITNRWFENEPCNLFIFEWESYEDALFYLLDCTETSSKRFNPTP